MNEDRLQRLLDELHGEIASAGTLDDETRRELAALSDELRAVAEREDRGEDGGLRQRLEEQVQRFEASHPTLARSLANLIDTLALYGL